MKRFLCGVGIVLVVGAATALTVGFVFDRGGYIGLVEIEGALVDPDKTVQWIEKLSEDSRVKVILVKIDSPGGEVVAADEIYRALLRARQEHKKPVVVYMGAVAASGGYYISCAADSIIASPGTITGSIGVIMTLPVIEGTLKKMGAEVEVVKSDEHKDITSPFRKRTEAEMALLDTAVQDIYDQFVDVVVSGRRLSREDVLRVADGRILTGRQAAQMGLVDRTGSYHDAVECAKAMGKLKEAKLMKKPKKPSLIRFLLYGDEDEDVLGELKTLLSPRIEYRWQ
ncbi:MAG: signal peptide peptidase SppA [candidate division WOR-3 bacterium]